MMQGQNFLSSVIGGMVGSLAASVWSAMMNGVGLGQFSQSVYDMVTFRALSGGVVAGLNHAMHRLVGQGDDELIKKLTPEQRKNLESIKSGSKLTKESLEILKLDKVLDNWIEKTALGKNLKVGVLDYLEMGGEIYYDYKLMNYGAVTKSEFNFRFVTTSSKGLIAGHFGNLAGGYIGSQYGAVVGGLAGAVTGWALGIYIENTYVSGARFFINYMINFGNNLRNQVTFNIINAGH